MKSGLYTRKGDKGRTTLAGGRGVAKSDVRLESYGTIDELNAFVGLLIAEVVEAADKAFLREVQRWLFAVGGYLASEGVGCSRLTDASVARVEGEIDRLDADLPSLRRFVLPAGSRLVGLAHVCRTVCRRAERRVCGLQALGVEVDGRVLAMLNRLSDYFFVLARKEGVRSKGGEKYWDNKCI